MKGKQSKSFSEELENTLFLGVDIGTETCKVVLMEAGNRNEGEFKYNILEANRKPTQFATDRSRIANVDKTIEILQDIVEETTAGHSGSIYTSFTVHDRTLRSKVNRVKNPFSKHDRIIEQKDVNFALEMAGNAQIENDREYLHVMPRAFYVNNEITNENPVGLTGSSLDAEVLLVSVLKDSIKQLVYCANAIEYPCNFICATPFATGEAVLTTKEKAEGALVIDLGAGNTSATLFEKNMPKAMSILPLGGMDITNDISQVLNIPFEKAEEIKISYGVVDKEYLGMFNESFRVDIRGQIHEILLEDVYKIVLARTVEIISILKQQLFTANTPFPYPVIVTGGSARILGLKQLIEKIFKTNTRIAQPWNWGGPSEKYRDPSFSSVIGVCIAGLQHYTINGWSSFISEEQQKQTSAHRLSDSLKRAYSNVSDKFHDFLSLDDIE